MTRRRTLARLLVLGSLIAGGLVAASSPAAADFHFMKITEVDGGTVSDPNSDFVELQMYQAGQNIVGSHVVKFYSAAGSVMDCTIPSNVMGGNNQDHILMGTSQSATDTGTAPDFILPTPLVDANAGAICFENIDCVAWGSFSGPTASPVGTPEAVIGGNETLQRDLKGDGTLQDADDTDNSANDFNQATETAMNNGSPPGTTMTCQPGQPGGGGGGASLKGLKAKVRGNKAVITGTIQPPNPGKKVKLTFFANGSPLRKIAKKSATLNADSKFKKSFRVPTDSTRCKVKVAFQGQAVGQKKFKC